MPRNVVSCRIPQIRLGFAGQHSRSRAGLSNINVIGCLHMEAGGRSSVQEGLPAEGLCVYHDKQFAATLACIARFTTSFADFVFIP